MPVRGDYRNAWQRQRDEKPKLDGLDGARYRDRWERFQRNAAACYNDLRRCVLLAESPDVDEWDVHALESKIEMLEGQCAWARRRLAERRLADGVRETLEKARALLTSPHEGERDAAARAVARIEAKLDRMSSPTGGA